jgi:hypothetical protein
VDVKSETHDFLTSRRARVTPEEFSAIAFAATGGSGFRLFEAGWCVGGYSQLKEEATCPSG